MSFLLPPPALPSSPIARSLFALSCLVTAALPTVAAYNPLEAAMGFNVFVQNNMALGDGHVEGGTAVGGSIVMNGTANYGMTAAGTYKVNSADATATSLAVKGRIVWSGNLAIGGKTITATSSNTKINNGWIAIGDTTGTYYWGNGGRQDWGSSLAETNFRLSSSTQSRDDSPRLETSSIAQSPASMSRDPGIDFAARFLSFRQTAVTLASIASNTLGTFAVGDSTKLTLTLVANRVNFYTIDAASFGSLSDRIALTGASLSHDTGLVFNITGSGTAKFGSFNEFDKAMAPYILYNFASATSVEMSDRTISGSILAPNAVFTHRNQNVDGQIIAASFIQEGGGETHNVMLDLQVVPEPAAVAALLGLFVLGFVAWRRRGARP